MNKIEELIDYKFKNQKVLTQALTHSSISKNYNYERLEFLGDSIIGFFTSNWLFNNFNRNNEANLSIKKAQIINNINLSKISKRLGLHKYLNINDKIKLSDRIHSNIFESIVGAIYLDSNYKEVQRFLDKYLFSDIDSFNKHIDYKGPLISLYKRNLLTHLLIETNKYNKNNNFISKIIINDSYYFYGFALNKIMAEQRAAISAYQFIKENML
tara:strand:- start:284 stop:922 length:639 start_codon:yes stop_codon:yes gene_type:complete